MKKIPYLVGSIVIALLIMYLITFKPYLRHPTAMDLFFKDVAKDFNAPDICDMIHRWAYSSGVFGGDPPISYTRSECYREVALKTKNPGLCKKVKPLSTLFLNGNAYSEERCIDDVANVRPGYNPPLISGAYKLYEILPRIGFSEERIRSYSPNSQFVGYSGEELFYYFYSNLQRGHFQNPPGKMPIKEEFLEGVRKL